MICLKSDIDSVQKCVSALKNGKIVIIPTDTVYGFSGIVDSTHDTDGLIRKIKGREKYKPFIQLIASPDDIYKYTDDVIPQNLLNYWPGPLTIIVNKKGESFNSECPETVAFRCPGDEWLRKIIKECDAPIYSTSVNRSGQPILETEDDILKEFNLDVDLIVKDGDRKNSLPSTIVKTTKNGFEVIRKGAVEL